MGFVKIELAAGNATGVMTWFSAFDAIVATLQNGPPPRCSSCQPWLRAARGHR